MATDPTPAPTAAPEDYGDCWVIVHGTKRTLRALVQESAEAGPMHPDSVSRVLHLTVDLASLAGDTMRFNALGYFLKCGAHASISERSTG